MRQVSNKYREVIQSVNASEQPLDMLELFYAGNTVARLVRNTEDIVSNGQRYLACMFSFKAPDDTEKQSPRAQIQIDNVSSGLVRFIEQTHGARGLEVRWLQVLPSTPDVVEIDVWMELANISITPSTISLDIGFEDLLKTACISYGYTVGTAPGLF
jgi:Domain of unknown function (DUF1833)